VLYWKSFYITSNDANGKNSSSYYTILGPHSDVYTYTHTHIYIYIYIYVCVCVCVCVYTYMEQSLF